LGQAPDLPWEDVPFGVRLVAPLAWKRWRSRWAEAGSLWKLRDLQSLRRRSLSV